MTYLICYTYTCSGNGVGNGHAFIDLPALTKDAAMDLPDKVQAHLESTKGYAGVHVVLTNIIKLESADAQKGANE